MMIDKINEINEIADITSEVEGSISNEDHTDAITITTTKSATKCGYVAIIGRPNVGKSTLLNRFIGQKISITSRKPQTTRHKILGIKTKENDGVQIVYVDTPGLHQIKKGCDRELNRYMNKTVYRALSGIDVIVFMVEGAVWRDEDEWIFNKLNKFEQQWKMQREKEVSKEQEQDAKKEQQELVVSGSVSAVEEVEEIAAAVAEGAMISEDDMVESEISRDHDSQRGGASLSIPIILVINKVDQIKPREKLLPYLELLSKKMNFSAIFPISARRGTNVDALETQIIKLLPPSPFFYFPEQVTDQSTDFRVTEIIREKLIKSLGQELPYAISVEIEEINDCKQSGVMHISATILVERSGQKAIVIGTQGSRLKQIGTLARHELEKFFGQKVFLKLWVKVKENWTDDVRKLNELFLGH